MSVSITKAVHQSVQLIKGGYILCGSHKDTPEEEVVGYSYQDGEFYVHTGAYNPANRTAITYADLRARLEGHFNSLSEEEYAVDCNNIDKEYHKYQALTPKPSTSWIDEEPSDASVFGTPNPAFISYEDACLPCEVQQIPGLQEVVPPVGKLPRTPTGTQVTSAEIVILLEALEEHLYYEDLSDGARDVVTKLAGAVNPADIGYVNHLEIYLDSLNSQD